MNSEKLYNILEGFNFENLLNPEFKEDSVREEIVVPIIKGLGYTVDKPHQIIRSRKLLHPYVSIGSQKKNIYIVPDYLFEVNNKPAWILDAKAPNEVIVNSANVEQAYSYAIHPEVRVNYYALCNGKEFVLYNIHQAKPILYFNILELPLYWENVKKYIAADTVLLSNPFHLSKDLGLHLKRLGFDKFESLIFTNVPLTNIGQMDPDYFSTGGTVSLEGVDYVVSFDFPQSAMNQLAGKIPEKAFELLNIRKKDGRQIVKFADSVFKVNIDCKVGENLAENEKEIFLPLWINCFID